LLAGDPLPVLPIRLWQEGALLFAATAPSDPDHRLGLLEQGASEGWQWLPFIGADFPLQGYAQRGPLIAWTPHLAGVALKLDHKSAERPLRPAVRRRLLQTIFGIALLVLLAANLWATLLVYRRTLSGGSGEPFAETSRSSAVQTPRGGADTSNEQFALALYHFLEQQGAAHEWTPNQLRDEYQQVVRRNDRLRLNSPEGKALVGAVSRLSRRDAGHIEAMIREALASKGYDTELINLACRRVHERLATESRDAP
jgi:hypothetical protein